MSEEQYYTPVIEDFRIGYEYEMYEDFDHYPEKSWHKLIYGENGTDNPENLTYPFGSPNLEGRIRVPYLTKEQIEAEGWVLNTTLRPDILFQFLRKNFILVYNFNKRELRIAKDSMEGTIQTVQIFRGQCKSINEFRTIIKLLEI